MNLTELKSVTVIQLDPSPCCVNRSVASALVDRMSLDELVTSALLDFMDSDRKDAALVNVTTSDPWTTFVTLSPVNASVAVTLMEGSAMSVNLGSGIIPIVKGVIAMVTLIPAILKLVLASDAVITLQDPIVKFASEDFTEIHSLDTTSHVDRARVQEFQDLVSRTLTPVTWIQGRLIQFAAVFLDTLENGVIVVTTTTTEIQLFQVEVVRSVNVMVTPTWQQLETVTLEVENVSVACMKPKDSIVNDVALDGSAMPQSNSVPNVSVTILEPIAQGTVFAMQLLANVLATRTSLERSVMNVLLTTGTLPPEKAVKLVTVTLKEVTHSNVTCSKEFVTANLDLVDEDVTSARRITGVILVFSVSVSLLVYCFSNKFANTYLP